MLFDFDSWLFVVDSKKTKRVVKIRWRMAAAHQRGWCVWKLYSNTQNKEGLGECIGLSKNQISSETIPRVYVRTKLIHKQYLLLIYDNKEREQISIN